MLMCSASGIVDRRGLDLHVVNQVHHDAALLLARGFALEQARHFDRHALVGVDPQQVDVDQVLLERVPLNVLQQGLTRGVAGQVDHLVAVAQRGPQLVGGTVTITGSSPWP